MGLTIFVHKLFSGFLFSKCRSCAMFKVIEHEHFCFHKTLTILTGPKETDKGFRTAFPLWDACEGRELAQVHWKHSPIL